MMRGSRRKGGRMSSIGTRYFLDGASQNGETRDGINVVIPPNAVIVKVRDNFADRLKFRNMFVIESTGQEISIDQSIIERYFREVKDGE